ncbi:unnamed protein product [Cuscuta campestris]|uniref:TF-B3 domain-containing protein n=1 Tax=Cuscuta campestris TaxID=132261 RepID=A0A484K6Z5_9ASTE|nr:unnamed protein product [Cuscuta campestris]
MRRNLRSTAAKKTEFEDVPIEPLSGKPFFDHVISENKPLYQMVFPPRMYSDLPNGTVEAVIMHGKNTWETTLYGNKTKKSLDTQTWRHFLDDNNLRPGDALILEVMESSQVFLKFKAQILRGDFPVELDTQIDGGTPENAISID